MKQRIILLSLLTSTVLFLFCSCDNGTAQSRLEGQTVVTTQTISAESTPASDIMMTTQYPVYDDSCTYVSIVIENNSDTAIEYGTEWMMEKKVNGEWRQMEFVENFAFNQPLLSLQPGGTDIDICTLEYFRGKVTDGEYRVVKALDGVWYAAEFQIGDSPITAESPHGFTSLEKLPADYSVDAAVADGVVVCGYDGIKNAEKITEFFQYANHRKWKGQLRIARFTVEGDMTIMDIVRAQADRIDTYCDSTRDSYSTRDNWGSKEITLSYYSYFTTDGSNIYVSNHSTCDPYQDRELFSTGNVPAEAIEAVASYYDNPYGDFSAIAVYSPDGVVETSSSGGIEFSFNAPGWGTMWEMKKENQEDGMNIIDIVWQDNDICMIMAEKPDGTFYYEFIHVDRESMKNIKTVSYTTSAYRYEIYDGQIIIPE